jgi:AraC-like DNA-binding protein
VLDDVNIEAAAGAGAWGAFFHQGQICLTGGRHLVHESVANAYVNALVRKAKALVVGNPLDEKVQVGPIVNERQAANVERLVAETVAKGAKAADLLRANGAAGQTSEDYPLFKTEFPALAPWKILRIVAYVEQNLAAKLEVAQMAHLVGLSICHFSRSFKNSMGVTPRRYVLRKRVHRATQLMADPGESLTDIALACGFADQSHFSRVFKQILRLSPGIWRRYYIGPPGASEAGTSAKTAGTRKSASQPTDSWGTPAADGG